jgi:phosphoglycolate phosphatase-like HAD superfamily hydrolase
MGRRRHQRRVPRPIEPLVRDGASGLLTARALPVVPVFDLDGTLIDSDAALVAPFVALGVRVEDITFGHTLAVECARLGLEVDDYLDNYDDTLALPFAGVEDLVLQLDRWAVCSNKHPRGGRAELARLGWKPDVVMFTDSFDGPKHLGPVLDALGVQAREVIFVGDTDHDRQCALDVDCTFALAGWNPRVSAVAGDVVLARPLDLLGHLDGVGDLGHFDDLR